MCFVAVVDLNLVPSLHNSLPEAAATAAKADGAGFKRPLTPTACVEITLRIYRPTCDDSLHCYVYLQRNTEGNDECGRYAFDTSQAVIKKRFDAAVRNNGLSVSPSPAASCRLSETGEFVGEGK